MSKAFKLIKILSDKVAASCTSENVAFSVEDLIQEANRLPMQSCGSNEFAKAAEALSHIVESGIASNVALGRFRGASAPVTPGPSGCGAAGEGRQLNATPPRRHPTFLLRELPEALREPSCPVWTPPRPPRAQV